MAHAHEQAGATRIATVMVVTVSSTRTLENDASGDLLVQRVKDAGHAVVRGGIVRDDPMQIGAKLDQALGMAGMDVVLFTGGTGVSPRDVTSSVIRARLDRELPGFGELFRYLSYQEVGSAAMLSDAVGGVAQGRLVFALPGSAQACALAMDKLLLPELRHLLSELAKEPPLPVVSPVVRAAEPANAGAGRRLWAPVPIRSGAAAGPASTHPPTMTVVEMVMGTLEAEWAPELAPEVPEVLTRYAPVMDILNQAGERRAFRCQDGRTGTAFGYPNVTGRLSKVLLVREAAPYAEILAAHRGLAGTGVCAAEAPMPMLPDTGESLARISERRTQMRYPGTGTLFAVEASAVYFLEGGNVYRWDGRRRAESGSVPQALASLLLDWSQR